MVNFSAYLQGDLFIEAFPKNLRKKTFNILNKFSKIRQKHLIKIDQAVVKSHITGHSVFELKTYFKYDFLPRKKGFEI